MSIEAIRTLVHRYCDAVCRRDEELLRTVWASDAVWFLPPDRTATGRDACIELWKTATAPVEAAVQMVQHGEAREVDGNWIGRWYVVEYIKRLNGVANLLIAYYDDTYTVEDGEWRFASRAMTWIYRGTPDLAAPFTLPPADARLAP
jgi:hypothetical protein